MQSSCRPGEARSQPPSPPIDPVGAPELHDTLQAIDSPDREPSILLSAATPESGPSLWESESPQIICVITGGAQIKTKYFHIVEITTDRPFQ